MTNMKFLVATLLLAVVASAPVSDKCRQVQLKSTRSTQSVRCSSGQLFWKSPKGSIRVRFQGVKEELCLKQGDNAGADVMTISQKVGKKSKPVVFDSDGMACLKPTSKRVMLYIKGPAKKQKIPSTINFAVQSEISNLNSGAQPQPIKNKKTTQPNTPKPIRNNKTPDSNKNHPTIEERLGVDLDNSIESFVVKVGNFFWGILSKIFH